MVVDDLSTSDGSHLNPAVNLIEGSVTDFDLVISATKSADWVFHTAAWARVERSIEDPIGTHDVNVNGTLNVLRAAHLNGVSRVINSSSSSVYGDHQTHVMREDMTPKPKSPYALQKFVGEQYADMFARLFNMSIISLRYFNVYGLRQPGEGSYALVIPRFLRMRDQGEPLTVYGDGNQTRGYTHVSDVVEANILAATADLASGKHTVLNIGPRQEISVNEIARAIGGSVEYIMPNPRGEFEEFRKSADNSKARTLIGWEPKIPFAEGIKSLL